LILGQAVNAVANQLSPIDVESAAKIEKVWVAFSRFPYDRVWIRMNVAHPDGPAIIVVVLDHADDVYVPPSVDRIHRPD
jgi:acyl-CoA thioesterase